MPQSNSCFITGGKTLEELDCIYRSQGFVLVLLPFQHLAPPEVAGTIRFAFKDLVIGVIRLHIVLTDELIILTALHVAARVCRPTS